MNLEKYLQDEGVWYRFIKKKETIHTSDASQVTGISLDRITKNLISKTNEGEHVLLIVAGNRRVNLKAAAKALGVKNIRLLPFEYAESISGFPPGGTPSIGHRTPLRTVLDRELVEYETLFCGGGSRDLLLEVRVDDVIRLSKAVVSQISKNY